MKVLSPHTHYQNLRCQFSNSRELMHLSAEVRGKLEESAITKPVEETLQACVPIIIPLLRPTSFRAR